MRPTQVSLSAAGYSPWVACDYEQTPFDLSLAGICAGTISLTYNCQYTIDDLFADPQAPNTGWYRPVTISQATTVITVTNDGGPIGNGGTHGLSIGDYVKLTGTAGVLASNAAANVDGDYNVASVVSPTSYTLTSLVSQSFTGGVGSRATSARVFPLTGMTAVVGGTTARTYAAISGNLGPVRAVRLYLSAWVSGTCSLMVLQGMSK